MKINLVDIFLVLCLLQLSHQIENPTQCTCTDKSHCNPITSWDTTDKEVIVTTNGTSDYHQWLWETVTSVMILDDGWDMDLMCYTHSKGKQFGFFLNVPVITDPASEDIDTFINATMTHLNWRFADILTLDVVNLMGNCDYAAEHVDQIANVLKKIVEPLRRPKLKILFVMPWKPPCYDNNCGLAPQLAKLCDGIITSPDSFRTFCDLSCRAEPTIPYLKLLMGLQEYISSGFNQSNILIGIPWHGYNYTCDRYTELIGENIPSICHLKSSTQAGNATSSPQLCDVEGSRKRIMLDRYSDEHPQWVFTDEMYSLPDEEPFHQANDSNNVYHQAWFEDVGSLTVKYKLVNDYKLKGCVIYTADDLTYSQVITSQHFNSHMWSWLLHSILSTGEVKMTETNLNIAVTVAGVGCGMFVFGCLLGAIITCIIFRRKARLRSPFRQDILQDDFHDDDQHL